ncbi:hypothetical protein GCK32_000845 [Trichostrongylus colubriformis]|uniref:Uncharacterized protein n=1 Tax=Trichostrongylus colubriformis TaxID=6319 RepID=A0AAN8GDS3_TRICO
MIFPLHDLFSMVIEYGNNFEKATGKQRFGKSVSSAMRGMGKMAEIVPLYIVDCIVPCIVDFHLDQWNNQFRLRAEHDGSFMYQLRFIGAIVQRKLLRLATSASCRRITLEKVIRHHEMALIILLQVRPHAVIGLILFVMHSSRFSEEICLMCESALWSSADSPKLAKNSLVAKFVCVTRQWMWVILVEAVIRMSESLAKIELQPFAVDKHVAEALRLFHVSTVEAAATGHLAGIEGFTSDANQESMERIEVQRKKRFFVGTHVSDLVIIQDFITHQHYSEALVEEVILNMVTRGDLQYKIQRKVLYHVH